MYIHVYVNGGTFVSWEDGRSHTDTYIYAQHIDGDGKFLWENQGNLVSEKPGLFINVAIDNRNGLLVGYSTVQNAVVQYIDSQGNRVWGDSGVQVTNRQGNIYPGEVAVISDGFKGAFVGWSERSVGTTMGYTVFIQRLDSLGQIVFVANGIALTNDTLQNVDVNLSPDNEGPSPVFSGGSPYQPVYRFQDTISTCPRHRSSFR